MTSIFLVTTMCSVGDSDEGHDGGGLFGDTRLNNIDAQISA